MTLKLYKGGVELLPRAKDKIYYDIEESTYSTTVDDMTFYFSKLRRLEKFNEEYENNRQKMKRLLSYNYSVEMNVNELCDIVLYRKIETNSFRVYKDGEPLCLQNLVFNGKIVI